MAPTRQDSPDNGPPLSDHLVVIEIVAEGPSAGYLAHCWYDGWDGTRNADIGAAEAEAALHRMSPLGEPDPNSPYVRPAGRNATTA